MMPPYSLCVICQHAVIITPIKNPTAPPSTFSAKLSAKICGTIGAFSRPADMRPTMSEEKAPTGATAAPAAKERFLFLFYFFNRFFVIYRYSLLIIVLSIFHIITYIY